VRREKVRQGGMGIPSLDAWTKDQQTAFFPVSTKLTLEFF